MRFIRNFTIFIAIVIGCSDDGDEDVGARRAYEIEGADLESVVVPTEGHPGWTAVGHGVSHHGTANSTIPIATLPGRAGIEPQLSLEYNSRAPNGLLGVGWSLAGLSEISICPKRSGSDNVTEYDVDDPLYCRDGVPIRDDLVEGDISVANVERTADETWKLHLRNGRTLTYGSVDGRTDGLVTLTTPTRSFHYAFLLTKVEDRAGNYMTVSYDRTGSGPGVQWRPKEIRYTGHGELQGQRFVRFRYDTTRTDPDEVYVRGGLVVQRHRLTQIDVDYARKADGGDRFTVRKYQLGYEESIATRRSLLGSVQECDRYDVCREPVELYYNQPAPIPEAERDVATGLELPHYYPPLGEETPLHPRTIAMDVDGNGRDDLLVRHEALYWAGGDWVVYSNPDPTLWTVKDSNIPSNHAITPVDYDRNSVGDFFSFHMTGTGATQLSLYRLEKFIPDPGAPHNWEFVLSDPPLWDGPTCPYEQPVALLMGDFDGNGVGDPLVACKGTTGADWRMRLHSDATYSAGDIVPYAMYETEVPLDGALSASDAWHTVLDYDGNGRLDVLATSPEMECPWDPDPSAPTTQCFKQWELGPDGLFEAGDTLPLGADPAPTFLDVNGDGLRDVIAFDDPANGFSVRLNTGEGLAAPQPGLLPTADRSFEVHPTYGAWADYSTRQPFDVKVGDFNLDGRDDFVLLFDEPGREEESCGATVCKPWPTVAVLHLSVGTQFDTHEFGYPGPADWVYTDEYGLEPVERLGWGRTGVADTDGNGLPELFVGDSGEGVPSLVVRRYLEEIPDVLAEIKMDGHQLGTFEYEITKGLVYDGSYGTSPLNPAYRPGFGCDYPTSCVNDGMWVVSEHTDELGLRYSHFYEDGRTNVNGDGFLGFARHYVIDHDTLAVTETGFDNTDRIWRGHPTYQLRVVPDGSRFMASRTDYTYEETWVQEMETLLLKRRETSDFELNAWESGCTLDGSVTSHYCAPGDLGSAEAFRSQVLELDHDSLGTVTWLRRSAGADAIVEIDITPEHRPLEHLYGLPSRVVTTTSAFPGAASEVRTTEYDYDTLGLLEYVRVEPSAGGGYRRRTHYARDAMGLPSTVEVDDGSEVRPVTYGYDDENMHVETTTNALGTVYTGYEPTTGALAYIRDLNDVESRQFVDGFGRTRISNDGVGDSTVDYVVGSGGALEVHSQPLGAPETRVTVNYLGQSTEQRTESLTGWTVREADFDSRGRLGMIERPHPEGEEPTFEEFQYDNVGRLRVASLVGPESSPDRVLTYSENRVTVQRRDGSTREFEYDAWGRLAEAIEPKTTTKYYYDGAGNLELVQVEVGGSVRATEAWQVDPYGRLASHTRSDGSIETYTYTSFDELDETFLDGSDVSDRNYDSLGRLIEIVTPEEGPTSYVWDTGVNGVGRLGVAVTAEGEERHYDYDTLGRLDLETAVVDGTTYIVDREYDGENRLSGLRYGFDEDPARQMLMTYQYTGGYLTAAVDQRAHRAGTPFWTATAYDEYGRVKNEQFFNGASTTRTINPRTGRLGTLTTSEPGGAVSDIELLYDELGRLARRLNHVVGNEELYHYDDMDRLAAWEGFEEPHVFEYDELGNVTRRDEKELRYDDPSAPHRITSITDGRWSTTTAVVSFNTRSSRSPSTPRSTCRVRFQHLRTRPSSSTAPSATGR